MCSSDKRHRRTNITTRVDEVNGLPYWPEQPFWDQLVEKDIPPDTDFESHWNQHPPVDETTLKLGEHFDHVVLGVSLGAMAANGGQPGIADDLCRASPAFNAMVQNIPLVPSKAAQVWFFKSAEDLGQDPPRHAAVSGPEAFDIHADMSQILASEPDLKPPEQSLYYLCTTYDTQLYSKPSTAADTPAVAQSDVAGRFKAWKRKHGLNVWPAARNAKGKFDQAAISHEIVRANINPTDCCPSSAAGTTRHRLEANGTAFSNLYLAGCWTRTGMNTTCVESAVMSGMQAARALSGEPLEVFGEDFLHDLPWFDIFDEPLACLDKLIDRFTPFAHARFSSGLLGRSTKSEKWWVT